MGAPARRRRFVTRTNATIGAGASSELSLTRPDSAGAMAAGTTYFQNLTTTPDPNDPGDLAGKITLGLSATFAVAGIQLLKVALQDADGNDLFVVWDDTTGIAGNDTTLLPDILAAQPIGANEFIAVTLNNSTGGGITGWVDAVYDLGINFGQEGAV